MPKEEDKILLCLELQRKFMTFNVDEKNFVELYSIDATKYQDDTINLISYKTNVVIYQAVHPNI